MYVCGLARWPPRVWAGAMGRWGDSFHAAARGFRLGVYGEHTQGEHEDALAPLPLPRLFVGHPAALQRLARLVDRRPMPLLAASAALERLVAAVDRCANGGVGRKGHEASGAALEPRHVATRKPAAVPVLRSHRDVPALRAACALPQAFLAGGLQVARLSQRPRATGAALAVASEARGGAVALHGAMRLARRASDTPRVHANAPNKDAKTARTRCLTSLVRGIDASPCAFDPCVAPRLRAMSLLATLRGLGSHLRCAGGPLSLRAGVGQALGPAAAQMFVRGMKVRSAIKKRCEAMLKTRRASG